jgi:hypothetical protein
MLERDVRSFAESHARSVVAHDRAEMMSDVSFEISDQLTAILPELPSPLDEGIVETVELEGARARVVTRFGGRGNWVTVESWWAQHEKRPKIVALRVARAR